MSHLLTFGLLLVILVIVALSVHVATEIASRQKIIDKNSYEFWLIRKGLEK